MNKKVFFIAAFFAGSCAYVAQAQEAPVSTPPVAISEGQSATLNTQDAFLEAIKTYGQSTDDLVRQKLTTQFQTSMRQGIATAKRAIVKANEKNNDAAAETALALYEKKAALYDLFLKEIRGKNDKTAVITILKRYALLL